jgi:hypothetical protein
MCKMSRAKVLFIVFVGILFAVLAAAAAVASQNSQSTEQVAARVGEADDAATSLAAELSSAQSAPNDVDIFEPEADWKEIGPGQQIPAVSLHLALRLTQEVDNLIHTGA